MSIAKRGLFALTTLMLAASCMAADGLKIALKLERDGDTIASPSLWTTFGTSASIQADNHFKIEMVAHDQGSVADLSFKLYLNDGEGLKLIAEPRLLTEFGTKAAFSIKGEATALITLTVEPSRAEDPRITVKSAPPLR